MYNNHIADAVADMGYQSILCEKRDDMFTGGRGVSPTPCSRRAIQTSSSSRGTAN